MSASPTLRPALLAALVESGLSYEQSPEGDTDRVLAALDREALVEAFATALHDSLDGNDPHFGEVGCRWLARALVAALLGGTE